jgi:hypothetical protein
MARTYSGKEVRKMLEALGDRANEVVEMADHAQDNVASASFEPYFRFRDKVLEFEAFTIIVKQRVENVAEGEDDGFTARFDDCVGNHLKHMVAGSLQFLYALSANTTLPLGSKEVFLSDLRTLHNAREKLMQEKYANLIDDATRRNLDTGDEILAEIIDKAPSMLAFGDS